MKKLTLEELNILYQSLRMRRMYLEKNKEDEKMDELENKLINNIKILRLKEEEKRYKEESELKESMKKKERDRKELQDHANKVAKRISESGLFKL